MNLSKKQAITSPSKKPVKIFGAEEKSKKSFNVAQKGQNFPQIFEILHHDPIGTEGFCDLFVNESKRNGIEHLPDAAIAQFECFTAILLSANEKMNLTAIKTVSEVVSKHYIDCLLALPSLKDSKKVLDIGCGAGFPSIPFAIADKSLSVTALDSTDKKVKFVAETAKELQLANLSAVTGRAEEPETRKALGKFDTVTSRAVAKLSVLCELSLPYLTKGGKLVALKGAKGEEELAEAERAIKILGGFAEIKRYRLLLPDGHSEDRTIVTVAKTAETPPQYPRKYAEILKKPL